MKLTTITREGGTVYALIETTGASLSVTNPRKGATAMTQVEVTVTDTYGGELNYSWVRRYNVSPKQWTRRAIAHAAKAAAGMAGVRGRSSWDGECYEFRPYRACVALYTLPLED